MFYTKSFKYSSSVFSIILILTGALLLFFPSMTTTAVCIILGAVLIAQGITVFLSYLSSLKNNSPSVFLAFWAFCLVGMGAFVIIRSEVIISIIPFIIGIFVFISGMNNIFSAIKLKNSQYDRWTYSMAGAVLKTVLGMVILFNPFASALTMIMFLGAVLIYEGITSFIFARQLSKYITQDEVTIITKNTKQNDVIDTDFKDVE